MYSGMSGTVAVKQSLFIEMATNTINDLSRKNSNISVQSANPEVTKKIIDIFTSVYGNPSLCLELLRNIKNNTNAHATGLVLQSLNSDPKMSAFIQKSVKPLVLAGKNSSKAEDMTGTAQSSPGGTEAQLTNSQI